MTSHGTAMPGNEAGPIRTRNVVLVGPSGAGKTMLVEAILFLTKATNRLGSIADGTSICDFEDVEKRLGYSLSMAVASTVISDESLTGSSAEVRVNLIDTPGHADFVGEVRAGLRAADAALFVISAVDGIDGGTRMLWNECASVAMPRAVVITHIDQPRGNFSRVLEECAEAFGDGVHPLYVPVDGGLLGLLSGSVYQEPDARTRTVAPATSEQLAEVSDARDALIEGIITESEDDTLLDRYLAGEQVEFDTLVDDLEKAVARGAFYPVLPIVPLTGFGVPEVAELICRGFPTPAEHPMTMFTPAGVDRGPLGVDGRLVAEVVKTTTDPYVGRVSLVRVFRGTLLPDVPVHVSGHAAQFSGRKVDAIRHPDHDLDERVGVISRPVGGTLSGLPCAVAGDIVAVARLAHAETGDTLSDPAEPAVLAPWTIPEPLLPSAIAVKASSDEDKLVQGLNRIQAEDPTVRLEVDPRTEQMVLWTMGGQHLEVLLERLRSRTGVEVDISPVRVALRETVRAAASGLGRHVKQSGGHGQYAIAQVEVEPLAEGEGFEFVDKVVGGAVPRQFIASVEKGVRQQLSRGVDGHPMVDLRVRLVGGKAHSVDSSDAAFQMAGALALKEASKAAGVQLLEPWDSITVTVDDEFVGAVLTDLSTRRGRVRGTVPVDGRTEITAELPAIELVRYAVDLRSLARGTGVFSREYLRHLPAPDAVLPRLNGE